MGFSACGGPEVRVERAPQLELSTYKTFSWAPVKQLEQPKEFTTRRDDLLDHQIKTQVNEALKKQGLTEVTQSPALQVAYSVRVINSMEVTPGYYPEPYYSYWGDQPVNRLVEKKQGTVDIDLVDAKTGRLVWRGIAVSDVNDTGPSTKQVQESVAKILTDLPGQTKTG